VSAVPSPSVSPIFPRLLTPTDSLSFSAIVAETCGPFTCIPAILNEYRTPELNVRNGCLKAMSFLFEYIGEMGKDYIHSVVTCLEDALTDRDLVHRQTAGAIVKHLALGTAGLGNEDALLHLMNLIWPNVFESASPSLPPSYHR
jgi:splicing factor 3B subunit 1